MLATPEGTARYAARHERLAKGHWRNLRGLSVGSIGMGTYLGPDTDEGDANYVRAAQTALRLGCNLLDAAINYRHQRSERALGRALQEAFDAGQGSRQEVVVCTKGGYLPFDRTVPQDPHAWLQEQYLDRGIVRAHEVADGVHSIAPHFLRDQLQRSLRNLQLNAIDVYYVHNPEHALGSMPRDEVEGRLGESFAMLEKECDEKRVGAYGVATWNGLRAPPEAPGHLSLERLVALAQEAAGAEEHHFGVVQAPLNLAMHEALTSPTQEVRGEAMPLLAAAKALGVRVVGSAALLQGRLTQRLPPFVGGVLGLDSDAARALQFARSAPGITTALVGMGRASHAEANLALAKEEPAPEEQVRLLFEAAGKARA
jgi:aryl-alcohol dehydrogenase-like predicted oxidoreductase